MDSLLTGYPDDAQIYYKRGLVNFYLNDRQAIVADFVKCRELGFDQEKDFISSVVSKKYLVKQFTGKQGDQLTHGKDSTQIEIH